MKKAILMSSFLVIFLGSWWLFGSPGEAASIQEKTSWELERQTDLKKQKQMVSLFKEKGLSFNAIELIHVGPGKPYFSWWGHLLIRFVDSGEEGKDDFVLSFLADFNDFPLNKAKGLLGGYTVFPKIRFLSDYHDEYVIKEKRFFHRYQLKTNEKQRLKMKDLLMNWIHQPNNAGTYSFATNNCVGLVHKFFKNSQLKIIGIPSYFPAGTIEFYHKLGLIPDLNFQLGLKELTKL